MRNMTDEEFMELVDAGVAALPERTRALMQNVAIVIDDDLSPRKRRAMGFGKDDAIFGLYEGIPRTDRGVDYQALPDKITIFKQPILAAYDDPGDIKACVENTVWHEVAHHFGYGDPWIEREELRRGKDK